MKTRLLLLLVLLFEVHYVFCQANDSLESKTIEAIRLSTGVKGRIDSNNAFAELLSIAQQGYPKAMNAIGRQYIEGRGCTVDMSIGIEWLNKAADAGYAPALHNLGLVYKYGYSGIKQDMELAYYYMEKAAKSGFIIGMYDAGYMLYKGLGVAQSYKKAFEYFEEASNKEFAPAMYMLGLCYRNGYGVTQNSGLAFFWLSQASKNGYSFANDELLSEYSEFSTQHVKLRNAISMNIPETFSPISHLKLSQSETIDGEYEGVVVTYDWSGNVVIKETPLTLKLNSVGKNVIIEWCEEGIDTIKFGAIWNDSSLVFNDNIQGRKNHYDLNSTTLWQFKNARLQILNDESNNYLVGNVQIYSPITKEPYQPIYISLHKTFSKPTNQSDDEELLTVYPNPFSEGLNVSFYQKKLSEVKIGVYNSTGQCVRLLSIGNIEEGNHKIMIPLSLPRGVYVLKVHTKDKVIQTVVIRKSEI